MEPIPFPPRRERRLRSKGGLAASGPQTGEQQRKSGSSGFSRLLKAGLVLGPLVLLGQALDWSPENFLMSLPIVIIASYGLIALFLLISCIRFIGRIMSRNSEPEDEVYSEQVRKETELIIDDYRLNKPVNRGVETVLSVAVWAIFLNLLQPIFTVVMWLAGVRLFQTQVFSLSAIEATTFMFKFIFYLGLVSFIVLFSWASWNYWRYGRLNRRKPRPEMSNAEVAAFYNVPLTVVEEAREVKMAVCALDDKEGIHIKRVSLPIKEIVASILLLIMLYAPLSAEAVAHTFSLKQLGYADDITVIGSRSDFPVTFPMPRVPLLPGSNLNLVVEPGKFLNDNSIFTFYLNDRSLAVYSAGQLKARPNVQLPLPPDIGLLGPARLTISAHVYATDRICVDYQRGYLSYILRNSSSITYNFNNPAPRTVAEFLSTITRGVVIIVPDKPSPAEITAGAWAYGILQRYYSHLPVKFAFEKERGQYEGIPRVWVASKGHLPAAMSSYGDGLHLPFPDTLLITANDGAILGQMVSQLTSPEILAAIPSASINISVQNQVESKDKEKGKVYFGNSTSQSDILTVGIDFKLYPALLEEVPGSLKVRLQGRYSPSNIAGKQARLDVFANRTLIHSELLDDSGILDKEIYFPPSVPIRARNALGLEFVYPFETANCKVDGIFQTAQILKSSYFQGKDHLSFDQFTWQNIGIMFNKKGAIVISDYASDDIIRAVAETVAWLNNQLPVGAHALPTVYSTKDYSPAAKPAYLVLLGLVDEIPEDFQTGIPLQRTKNYTIYKKDDQSVIYRYQPAVNTVVGQVGHYKDIPMVSISANLQVGILAEALRHLQVQKNYDALSGDILVYNSGPQMLSIDSRSVKIVGEDFSSTYTTWFKTIWYKAVALVKRWQTPLLWGLGVVLVLIVVNLLFGRVGGRKK
jgi:poly-beta-1,6-N-acetyl-D-glucosamine biosynthesis protein PgaD